ncbi:MAG: DNA gyrase subunit A [Myxococcales bacterium]|nr:hypothetical protein [Myxococcota bacterium]MDW8284289.1 DNA gyrase subunit A [Myxococcales bacterium]
MVTRRYTRRWCAWYRTSRCATPIIAGHGSFGSLDGDAPAAYRYTECRLRPIAIELLDELKQNTVGFRPSFDGVRTEPVVLPAQIPNLLVNGVQGIAVGMATSIPPHNLGEVLDACLALIDDPTCSSKGCSGTGVALIFRRGEILSSKQALRKSYQRRHGSIRPRGQCRVEEPVDRRGSPSIVIASIPYGPTRASIMEKISPIIAEKKMPQLTDCRDESTSDVCMVLDTKGRGPHLIMAYR